MFTKIAMGEFTEAKSGRPVLGKNVLGGMSK